MSNVMKKFTKHSKRRGLLPTKVLFTIEVQNVVNLLPALTGVGEDAILSVCFERGGKMSCSTPLSFDSTKGKGTLEVKQTLSLVATLYQESSGEFQEKCAKLILRQSKTSRIVGIVYKGLGVVTLKLNELMAELSTETNKAIKFPMEILKGGESFINVIISARTIENEDDDTASLLSDSSDMSTMGAVFDPDDFPIGALVRIGNKSPNKKFQSLGYKRPSFVRRGSMTETIHEEEGGRNEEEEEDEEEEEEEEDSDSDSEDYAHKRHDKSDRQDRQEVTKKDMEKINGERNDTRDKKDKIDMKERKDAKEREIREEVEGGRATGGGAVGGLERRGGGDDKGEDGWRGEGETVSNSTTKDDISEQGISPEVKDRNSAENKDEIKTDNTSMLNISALNSSVCHVNDMTMSSMGDSNGNTPVKSSYNNTLRSTADYDNNNNNNSKNTSNNNRIGGSLDDNIRSTSPANYVNMRSYNNDRSNSPPPSLPLSSSVPNTLSPSRPPLARSVSENNSASNSVNTSINNSERNSVRNSIADSGANSRAPSFTTKSRRLSFQEILESLPAVPEKWVEQGVNRTIDRSGDRGGGGGVGGVGIGGAEEIRNDSHSNYNNSSNVGRSSVSKLFDESNGSNSPRDNTYSDGNSENNGQSSDNRDRGREIREREREERRERRGLSPADPNITNNGGRNPDSGVNGGRDITPTKGPPSRYVKSPWGEESVESIEAAAERVGIVLPVHMSKEMLDLLCKVEVMKKQIETRDVKIRALETDYSLEVETFKSQVTGLRTDLIIAQSSLKKETAARTALEKGFVTEDNYLTSRLAVAQKGVKELTSEYASCCAILRNTELDLVIARRELKIAKASEAAEMAAALEAAGVATSSALRRAELEEETDGMIESLINSKVQSADLAIQLDEEKKKIFVLRRRLQKYAEKIAAMELATVVQGLKRMQKPKVTMSCKE